MPMMPDQLERSARTTRRGYALLACAGAALGLAVLSTSGSARAQGQPPAAAPNAPNAPNAPPAPPAAAPGTPVAPGTAAAMPPAPPPPAAAPTQAGPMQAPPSAAQPPMQQPPQGQGYGYPPPQGYGYPPPQGYGYPPPAGAQGQTPPGYGQPAQGYPYGYPYYPPYYGEQPPPQRFERHSTGMMAGGVVLTTAGIIGVLVGSALASTAANQIPIYCEIPGGGVQICEQRADEPQLIAGYTVMITGFVALAAGIPLWVIGGKRVPVKDDGTSQTAQPQTSLQLFVGPQSASMRLSF